METCSENTWKFEKTYLFIIFLKFFSTSVTAMSIVPMFPAYYIFNGLLIILFILHIFWTTIILQIAIKSISAGKMDGDIRSDISSDS